MHKLILIGLLGLLGPTLINAQTIVSVDNLQISNDFLVSPANKELLLKPGQTGSFILHITNRTGSEAKFIVGAIELDNVFSNSDIASSSKVFPKLFSLVPYLMSPRTDFRLFHGEKMELPITIALPSYINEKALYGLVTITAGTDKTFSDYGNGARTLSRIGIPVLVRTNDMRQNSGRLIDFSTADGGRLYFKRELPLKLSYENDSDVYIRPHGKIVLTNIYGRTIRTIQIEPWFILPGTIRSQVIAIDISAHLGPYSAKLTIEDDYGKIVESVIVNYWVLPHSLLIIFSVAIILIYLMKRAITGMANNLRHK